MDPTQLGSNRTGTQVSPRQFRQMTEGTEELVQTAAADTSADSSESAVLALGGMRSDYLLEAGPLGSVPVPATLKGMAKSGKDMLTGTRMQALVDKLAERLAFERAGVRLYEALIAKARVRTDEVPQLELSRLEHFRDEEQQHFAMLAEAVMELGADPTAQTPCADLAGVEGMGLMQAITDPRTSVLQSLHAILAAELIDGDGWELLATLAREGGHEAMARRFEQAIRQEAEHLASVRQWFTEASLASGKVVKPRGGKAH